MHILIVLGTRPEAIKLLPLHRECIQQGHKCDIFFTVQHADMVDPLLEMFGMSREMCITPEECTDRSLTGMFVHFMNAIRTQLNSTRYAAIVVQGDTTTTLAGAMAAAYEQVPVVHVEAGLRSYDKASPFPEEINRCLVTPVTDIHFAPTAAARDNLLREGVAAEDVHVVGNTGIDTLFTIRQMLDTRTLDCSPFVNGIIQHAGSRNIILITGHRRENQEYGIGAICREISDLSLELKDSCVFVYVTHPSPNVQAAVDKHLATHDACLKIQALNYVDFVKLMSSSRVIVTDSGGIQEEAPSFNVFTVVTRDSTERSESLDLGYSELVGDDTKALRAAILREMSMEKPSRRFINPYGDGKASQKIISTLASRFKKGPA